MPRRGTDELFRSRGDAVKSVKKNIFLNISPSESPGELCEPGSKKKGFCEKKRCFNMAQEKKKKRGDAAKSGK